MVVLTVSAASRIGSLILAHGFPKSETPSLFLFNWSRGSDYCLCSFLIVLQWFFLCRSFKAFPIVSLIHESPRPELFQLRASHPTQSAYLLIAIWWQLLPNLFIAILCVTIIVTHQHLSILPSAQWVGTEVNHVEMPCVMCDTDPLHSPLVYDSLRSS